MIKIYMWYGNSFTEADQIDISFYPGAGYIGNIYKDGKIIGDYACNDSVKIEKTFHWLKIKW